MLTERARGEGERDAALAKHSATTVTATAAETHALAVARVAAVAHTAHPWRVWLLYSKAKINYVVDMSEKFEGIQTA